VVKSSGGKLPLLLDDIERALEFYTNTRKPHTDRLLRVVHHQIGTKTPVSGTLEEDARLVSRMRNRPDTVWLSEHDVEAAMGATIAQAEVHELKALGGEQDIQGKLESTVHSTRVKL
jgi:salicylate hydroxylase